MIAQSPGGAEHKSERNADVDVDEKKSDESAAESKNDREESKAEGKRSDRRVGKEEHATRVSQMREDRLREARDQYLEGLRSARQQYFETRKQAARARRNMFEPSSEMLEHLPLHSGQNAPTSCRNLSRTRFWDSEASGAQPGAEGKEEEEPELSLTEEEIEQEIDRLKTRSMEVEALLRVQFDNEGCIPECRTKLEQCSEFYENLGKLATQLNVLKGAAFQELLGRGTGNPRGNINRDRVTGLVKLETVITTHGELQQMVQLAEGLCDLVRVKIEDDNDLGLALSVVGDSLDFFTEMSKLAKLKGEEEHPFLQMLRTF